MLSRVATAGARGALRARLPAASAGGRTRVPLIQPAFQNFHAGERDENAVTARPLLPVVVERFDLRGAVLWVLLPGMFESCRRRPLALHMTRGHPVAGVGALPLSASRPRTIHPCSKLHLLAAACTALVLRIGHTLGCPQIVRFWRRGPMRAAARGKL